MASGTRVQNQRHERLVVRARAGRGTSALIVSLRCFPKDGRGAVPVVVLSDRFWQERFAANSAAIGQQIKLNQTFFTIIGVTPAAFNGTSQVGYRPAVTIPIAAEPLVRGEASRLGTATKPGVWWLDVMGRLKPKASYEQARESLTSVFQAAALEVMPP